jgi:hypothetical protein
MIGCCDFSRPVCKYEASGITPWKQEWAAMWRPCMYSDCDQTPTVLVPPATDQRCGVFPHSQYRSAEVYRMVFDSAGHQVRDLNRRTTINKFTGEEVSLYYGNSGENGTIEHRFPGMCNPITGIPANGGESYYHHIPIANGEVPLVDYSDRITDAEFRSLFSALAGRMGDFNSVPDPTPDPRGLLSYQPRGYFYDRDGNVLRMPDDLLWPTPPGANPCLIAEIHLNGGAGVAPYSGFPGALYHDFDQELPGADFSIFLLLFKSRAQFRNFTNDVIRGVVRTWRRDYTTEFRAVELSCVPVVIDSGGHIELEAPEQVTLDEFLYDYNVNGGGPEVYAWRELDTTVQTC